MVAATRGVDHHQRVIGDHQVGLRGGSRGAFDEALPVMRAPRIDALPALIGQRGNPSPGKQRAKPAGQIAADHVAIARILRPARDQLRKHRAPPGKTSLHRVFEIEQAQVILAPLAHHHRRTAIWALLGPCTPALTPQLTLEVLGVGADPERALRSLRPHARRREITQRLANPRTRLRQQQVRAAFGIARSENAGDFARIGALAFALFGAFSGQASKLPVHLFLTDGDLRGLRSFRRFFPLGQGREQPAFRAFGLRYERSEHLRPRPARASERLQRAPRPVPFFPVVPTADREHRHQSFAQEKRCRRIVFGRLDLQCRSKALGGRYAEARGMQEGVEFQQIETRKVGIAKPCRDQWRVQHEHGCIGAGIDRLPLADLLRGTAWRAQPQTSMAGVECGQSRRVWGRRGHRAPMSGVRNEK